MNRYTINLGGLQASVTAYQLVDLIKSALLELTRIDGTSGKIAEVEVSNIVFDLTPAQTYQLFRDAVSIFDAEFQSINLGDLK